MRLQDEVNSTFLWACMKAMKMGLEGLLIQNSALTIPSVTRPFAGKNMLWPITYIFCLVKDWEFCKLFSVQWSLSLVILTLFQIIIKVSRIDLNLRVSQEKKSGTFEEQPR